MKYFLALLLISLAIGKSLHSAAAQQKDPVPRIGFLAPARTGTSFYDVFRDALHKLGYIEGKNVWFEFRSGDNRARLTTLATELVQRNVHIIVTPGGAVNAARTATTTIPIVFSFSGDPVEAGLVQSLAKPAGNMTGLTWLSFELVGKRLELLKEAVPHIARVAVLANPAHPGEKRELQETQSTARQLGIKLLYQQIGPTDDLEAILSSITKGDPDALLVFPDSVTLDQSKNIARFAVAQRLPSVFGWKEYVEAGGLISYGPDREETLRRVAVYVDKILKGRKPGDLPVEQPRKFEFVINLVTAKQIGLVIPPNVLARADKLIR